MCPVCLATAAMIAGSIVTTGGLAALIVKKVATSAVRTGRFESSSEDFRPAKEDRHDEHDDGSRAPQGRSAR
jgi:hypothetical protein